MKQAVFLDRDGTINREVNYLGKIEDLRLLPGTASAIQTLNRAGFIVIVISNQSGIARGYFDPETVESINNEIQKRLKRKKAYIDAFYYCPHLPGAEAAEYNLECNCRKPGNGLFLKAGENFHINMACSFAIGDKIRDLIPALKMGAKGVLVRTGQGIEEIKNRARWKAEPHFIADNLLHAVQWIMDTR